MTKDGGPAFPVLDDNGYNQPYTRSPGMSLRDWFAGQALGGQTTTKGANETLPACMARFALECYAMADAMLKARDAQD